MSDRTRTWKRETKEERIEREESRQPAKIIDFDSRLNDSRDYSAYNAECKRQA